MLDKIVGTIFFAVGLTVGAAFLFPDNTQKIASGAQAFFQSFVAIDHSDELGPEVKKVMQKDLDQHWKRAMDNPLVAMGTLFTAMVVGENNLPTKVVDVQLMNESQREYTGYAEFNSGEKVKLKVIYDGKQFMYETL